MNLLQATARRTAGLIGRESGLIRRLRPAYENFLEWTGNGRGIPWIINGVTYRIDPHYRHRLGKNYDPQVAEFLRARVKPGDLCIDVGANVGVYVLQFAHWSGPAGRVIAFEPNPGAGKVLERHVQMNNLSGRVEIVPAAVGEKSGAAILYAAEADGMSRLGAPNKELQGKTHEVKVPVGTLDEYCESNELIPNWLFMDIEGFEIAALAGARQLLESLRGKLGVVVEMHPNVWDSANTTRARAERLLAELRLRAIPITGQDDPLGDHGIVHLAYV
ncbi:MAG TPA: FkbM family methyltransferase [Pyrinomonadaceae bacterium]|nr:FkbM family methyltransferase [Pyrinomonadaceae bacterium]